MRKLKGTTDTERLWCLSTFLVFQVRYVSAIGVCNTQKPFRNIGVVSLARTKPVLVTVSRTLQDVRLIEKALRSFLIGYHSDERVQCLYEEKEEGIGVKIEVSC